VPNFYCFCGRTGITNNSLNSLATRDAEYCLCPIVREVPKRSTRV
ncbi:hypothetical protein AVDCRST_MAG92-3144, partial [uncultured Coleofasciculus sp.]